MIWLKNSVPLIRCGHWLWSRSFFLCSSFLKCLHPFEAEKVIASVYRSSMVPLARDMQILLLRNNLYTRKLLHNMKILPDPHCHLCPQEVDCRFHRFWSCPHSQRIWKFINKVLEETRDSPIFEKEAMLGEKLLFCMQSGTSTRQRER